MEYNNNPYYSSSAIDLDTKISSVMKRVYVKMFLGLLVTAFAAVLCSTAGRDFFLTNRWFMWLCLIGEFGILFTVSGAINKLSSSTATLLFFLFAALNGASLFPIMLVYTQTSIVKTFFITAGVFGAMSVYGYFTTQDLSRWGSILVMALIGLIICSLVNIFLHSSTMEWLISGAGVLIFIGLTAWDTQQIKAMALQAPMESVGKLATLGALSLYLDFLNMFLFLLRFFGNRD